MNKKLVTIGCMLLGLLVCTQSVEARYDYELAYGPSDRSSGFRSAADMDDWLERGRAAVTESPVFADGTRITAWGGAKADEPGLASAMYYFSVPRWAQYLTIKIRYRDTAQDDQIAARLWIKSSDTDMRGATGVGEEAPFYGDTFVLRSERSSESITVPTSRHVEGGMVELHVVASGSDCIDVRDIRVEYLTSKPQITVVNRTCNDYWDRYPRHRYAYHYFYWGPLFWPRTYVVYECWDVPTRFYWATWRPWFFVNIIRLHYHRPWWGPRRYTVVYHVNVKHPFHKRRPLLRKRLKERRPLVTKTIRPKPIFRKNERAPFPKAQEVHVKKKEHVPQIFKTRIKQNPKQYPPKKQPVGIKKQGKDIPKAKSKVKQAPVRGHDVGRQTQISRRDNIKQKSIVQRRPGIGEKTKPQSHRKNRQPRPQPGQRRSR